MFCVGIPKRSYGESFLKSCFDRLSRIMQMRESVWGGETQKWKDQNLRSSELTCEVEKN
jgi:hypothetical protein